MKKTDLKTELVSFVFIALILGSIFAGVVSAENVCNNITYENSNKQNLTNIRADHPDSTKEVSYSKKVMSLSRKLHTQSQAGETVVVTSGDNLDKYLFWPNTIEPDIPVQTNDADIHSGELTLSIYDVDEYCGSACNGVCEVDTVYFNGHYLGTLTGANNQWSTTTFILDPSWINGANGGSPGINHVKINIDTASHYCWAVECDWVQLIINAGAKGNARIVSLSTDKQAYSPGNSINVAIDLTTDIDSQSVRLETNLYDPVGVNIDGSSTTLTLHKNEITSVNRQLSIPANAPSGEYTVEAIVYDSASVQQDKKTVIVTVGEDPDFYITTQDISFSQIIRGSGSLEVSVDTSIHYENDNIPRDVDVKFYDEDITTGSKTFVHSERVSMSPGVNTVSIVWIASSYQHRLCVAIDPDDKIEETNENNNEACKPLEGPTIDDVKQKYKGYFLSGISVDNIYYVFTSGNVDHVEFDMNGNIKTDSDGSNEWSMMYDMKTLNSLSPNTLTIIAYDANGIPSEPFVVTPIIINTPIWLVAVMNIGGLIVPWSLTHLAHDNILQYKIDIQVPKHPINVHFTIPSCIVIIPTGPLAGEYGFGFKFKFGFDFKSDGYSGVYGGGKAKLSVADHGGEVGLTLGGAPYLDILDGYKLKLGSANIDGYGEIDLPLTKHNYDFNVAKVLAIVKIIPKLGLSLNFVESTKDTIIAGLAWDHGGASVSSALEGTVSSGASGMGAEGVLGAEPELFAKVASQDALVAFDKIVMTIYAKIYTIFSWGKVKVFDGEYQWQYPPSASSLKMPLVSLNSIIEGEWEPIPRDYATSNYARFVADGAKNKIKATEMNTFEVNVLGAHEDSMIENVFPYAFPSIATDNDGNAIMVWTHDDINKPQAQGFEIYYSKWNGNDWSSPGAITNNYLPEFDPSIKFDSNGNAVAVWIVYNNSSITANTSAFSVLQDVEIAYSVWNKTTSTWSASKTITNNSMFDNIPQLSSDLNGNIGLVWVCDKDNDTTTAFDRDIYFTYWNGSNWNNSEIIESDVAVVDEPTIAYTNNNAICVWSQDIDKDIITTADRDLYYSTWDGNSWSASVRITEDNIEDGMPTVMYDRSGSIVSSWVKTNNTADKVYISTYTTGGWSNPELCVESQLIDGMMLAFDSKNNAVITWGGISNTTQDIFYTVRDNSNQLWRGEKQLTNDTLIDWQLSASIDSDDNLMIASVKRNITIVNKTIEGESNLCYLIHPIMLDLTLDSSDITFSNETAYPGDTIAINATIHNIGDLQANLVEVKFSDGLSGPQIGTTQTIPSLPAGQNATVSVTWNIPALQQSHDIYVKVDPDDKLPETNESNNEAFASIVLPDLKINESDVTFSYEHGSLRINATVHNSGVIAASNVPVELFDEGVYGTLINATTIASLSPNSNETVSVIWNTQGVSSGIHNISVIIDRIDGIREQNETNNIANLSLMILPDLTVNANNVSFSETSEGNITIGVNIRNIGISNAENIMIGFFDGDPFASGTLIDSVMIDSLSVNNESSTEISWYATPGQHDIYVQIDPSNLILELDKSNNLALNPMIITPGADLMLNSSDIIFSDANETGQVSISTIIHNADFADVLYTTVEFYNGTPNVSVTNPYVTNIPNSLGTEVVPLVSSKGYVIVNLSANWTPMENMTYSIYVMVDPKDIVHESNESNNMAYNTYMLDTTPPSVTNPTATPPSIVADGIQESQLTVTVTDESGIASVTVDLSAIGGSATQEMNNIPGTDVYTVNTTAAVGTAPDTYELPVNATDSCGNSNTSVCVAVTVTESGDTTPPAIESVTLDAYTTIPDATIHVTVEATDDVAVTSVTADGINLEEAGSIWEGNITAPSATGSYTLTIRAEDAAENFAETTVEYSVVKPGGSIGIGVDPRLTTITAGDTALINIKLVSTENFDDIAYVYLTTEGVYPGYEANLTWFNWTSKYVKVPAGAEVNVPLEASIPGGESGYKVFYAKLESTKWTPTAMDTGILYVV